MDLIQYSSSDSESAEEMDKSDDLRADSCSKSSEPETKVAKSGNGEDPPERRKSKDGKQSLNMELSEESNEKLLSRKNKRSSPERRSRDRESSYKKSRSRRDRSEDRTRSSYDDRKRRSDDRSRHHHSSREDYDERRHKSDKYRHNDYSSRRDDRRRRDDKGDRGDKYSDRHKHRSNSDRGSGRYSESERYKRSSRDDRRSKRSKSRSASHEKRDTRHRSHSKSKEKESSDNKRLVSPPVTTTTIDSCNQISRTVNDKEREKSPEISAVLAPPINTMNPVAAERKLAKLDQLGITLHANTLTATSSIPGVKLPEGVEIPAYYNPNAINVTKYAEQIQKRKLLWSGKKSEPVAATSTWNKATFSQDTDGKVASKFMRLMGIKDGQAKPSGETGENDLDKQKKLFSTMEQQYEVARQVTHTMRGVGLGFGSQPRQF